MTARSAARLHVPGPAAELRAPSDACGPRPPSRTAAAGAEAETAALQEWLAPQAETPVVTSELGRVEVLRAARRAGDEALAEARILMGDVDLVPLDRGVQDLACEIGGPLLRTLDAWHLASAVLLRQELSAFVAYDRRLSDAARAVGLPAITPRRQVK